MELLVENRGTKLFTRIYPADSKETVILLHGGPGVPDGLDVIAEHLSSGYQVILFDQRGTLKSPSQNNDFSIESYISDINSIASHFNLSTFHLLGHSWGGIYAQFYAAKHPDNIESLFLLGPGPGTGRHWLKAMFEIVAFNRSRCTFSEWVQMGINSILGMMGSDIAYQKLFTQMSLNFNRGFTTSKLVPFDISSIKAKPIIPTTLAALRYPILDPMPHAPFKITVLYGEGDIIGESKKYLRNRYPSAKFYVISNSGHLPWLNNETEFLERLEEHFGYSNNVLLAKPSGEALQTSPDG